MFDLSNFKIYLKIYIFCKVMIGKYKTKHLATLRQLVHTALHCYMRIANCFPSYKHLFFCYPVFL